MKLVTLDWFSQFLSTVQRVSLLHSLLLETCKCIQIPTVFVLVDSDPLSLSGYLKQKKMKTRTVHSMDFMVSLNLGEKAMVKCSHLSPRVRALIVAFSNLLLWNSPSEKSFLALVSCHVSNLKLLLSSRNCNWWNFCSFFKYLLNDYGFTSTVIDSGDSELSKIWPRSCSHRNSSLVGRQTQSNKKHTLHIEFLLLLCY